MAVRGRKHLFSLLELLTIALLSTLFVIRSRRWIQHRSRLANAYANDRDQFYEEAV
jgi:hypothetical protein